MIDFQFFKNTTSTDLLSAQMSTPWGSSARAAPISAEEHVLLCPFKGSIAKLGNQ